MMHEARAENKLFLVPYIEETVEEQLFKIAEKRAFLLKMENDKIERSEITIYVATLTGKTLTIATRLCDKVNDIKEKIQDKEGISPCQQQLIAITVGIDGTRVGIQVENWRTLSYYKVKDGDKLNLVLRLRGC